MGLLTLMTYGAFCIALGVMCGIGYERNYRKTKSNLFNVKKCKNTTVEFGNIHIGDKHD